MKTKLAISLLILGASVFFTGCSDYFKNDYRDNSPTSGKLKVYYDEGLQTHVLNQIATFEAHYHNAHVEPFATGEAEAIQALYNDSCETIVIQRNLTEKEKKSFAGKKQVTYHSIVAYTGMAVLVNNSAGLRFATVKQISDYLINGTSLKDTNGLAYRPQIVMDRLNSGSIHYLLDSVLKTKSLAISPYFAGSSEAAVRYIEQTPNTLGLIDFSGVSDVDDPFRKKVDSTCHFLALAANDTNNYEYPDQSSFKLGTYPWMRAVFVIRKSGEFSLAKGFESFVAGPKGQTTFLKQGLLPTRQAERAVQIKLEGRETRD